MYRMLGHGGVAQALQSISALQTLWPVERSPSVSETAGMTLLIPPLPGYEHPFRFVAELLW
jgi:hypothetical protein